MKRGDVLRSLKDKITQHDACGANFNRMMMSIDGHFYLTFQMK
jgi:hypothetical protein